MKTPQTDDLARGNHVVPTEWAEQLERERDEARKKYDNEATEHMLAVNRICNERDEALNAIHTYRCEVEAWELLSQARRERDEAKTELEMWRDGNIMHQIHKDECEKAERERNEAQKELSSIHQWIERNHPDGFIDSQTYFQNLERFVDNWYDRLDRLEVDAKRFVRERDEAREIAQQLINIASHCLGWHENANPETITEAIKRWNASTKK